jgi:hypothetical protein
LVHTVRITSAFGASPAGKSTPGPGRLFARHSPEERVNGDAPPREAMKYLLLLLFCIACTVVSLSRPRTENAATSSPPSPALLDAMSSHGIEVGTAADPAADATSPSMEPVAAPAGGAPLLQPAVYRRGR